MVARLRDWLPFVTAGVVGALSPGRADSEPLQLVQLRLDARTVLLTRAASLCGLGSCPAAAVSSAAASAPFLVAATARAAPPTAERLDLSPWLIQDGTRMATLQDNSSEYAACVHALLVAFRTPPGELGRGVRRDLTPAHLAEEPAKYRGELIRIMGTMRRIRRFDPPARAAAEGVRDLYEGWVFDTSAYGAHPVCVLFSELPEDMDAGERLAYPVAFDGYFFKQYRYTGADGRPRDTPLLIGRAPILRRHAAGAAEEGLTQGASMVMGFLGLLAGTLLFALGLAWWYQRGDRRIRARLDASRTRAAVNPFGDN